jgi:hypothetical protein
MAIAAPYLLDGKDTTRTAVKGLTPTLVAPPGLGLGELGHGYEVFMSTRIHQSGKYTAWVILAWALFAVSVVASFVLIKSSGALDAPVGSYGPLGLTGDQFMIVMVCAGQCLVSLIMAGGFTMLNGIYEAVIDREASAQEAG